MAFRLALKLGCTVRELLDRITAHELAEWQAFERIYGPIDDTWRDAMLVEVHYQLQLANAYFLSANSDEDDEMHEPERATAPWDAYRVAKERG